MNRITGDYINVLLAALVLHRPVASSNLIPAIDDFFLQLQMRDMRQPNDWCPEYTSAFTLRWYDGKGDSLSGSSKSCQVTITKGDKGVRYSLRATLDRSSMNREGCSINDLESAEDAVEILDVLLAVVDRNRQGDL